MNDEKKREEAAAAENEQEIEVEVTDAHELCAGGIGAELHGQDDQ